MNSILFLVVDSVIFENLFFNLFILKLTMAPWRRAPFGCWIVDGWYKNLAEEGDGNTEITGTMALLGGFLTLTR